MPRGRTNSQLRLAQRKRRAFDMFVEGYSPSEVATELGVTQDTAARYKKQYQEQIANEAASNPQLLTKTLENTLAALAENDRIRRVLWEGHSAATVDRDVECPECGADILIPHAAHTAVNGYMSNLIKAQEQRAKLFNLFGVKADYFLYVQNVSLVQTKLLEWMRTNLCEQDREALARFMETELAEHMPQSGMPVIDVHAIEMASQQSA